MGATLRVLSIVPTIVQIPVVLEAFLADVAHSASTLVGIYRGLLGAALLLRGEGPIVRMSFDSIVGDHGHVPLRWPHSTDRSCLQPLELLQAAHLLCVLLFLVLCHLVLDRAQIRPELNHQLSIKPPEPGSLLTQKGASNRA